jgi:hypothetical protein
VILIIAGILGGWPGLLSGFLVPLTGYLVLSYQDNLSERYHTFRYRIMKMKNPALISELTSLRKDIITSLDRVEIGNTSV